MSKKGLILLAFGTSRLEGYERSLKALKIKGEEAFETCKVELVFTSEKIRGKLKEKHEIEIKTLEEALEQFSAEGIKEIYLQPLNIFQSKEDAALKSVLEKSKENQGFYKVILGTPLLPNNEKEFIEALLSVMKDNGYKTFLDMAEENIEPKEGWLLMGHGSKASDNEVFLQLQESINASGHKNIHIATIDGEPTIKSVVQILLKKNYEKINIMPILLTPGFHIMEDLCGVKEESWENILKKHGFLVNAIAKGLGEYEEFQRIYLNKIKLLLRQFK